MSGVSDDTVVLATFMWQHDFVNREQAMDELMDAVADLRAQPERLLRVSAAFYAAKQAGVRQRDMVARTGYNRERVRQLIEDERIRRGEIPPTRRYLAAQDRASAVA